MMPEYCKHCGIALSNAGPFFMSLGIEPVCVDCYEEELEDAEFADRDDSYDDDCEWWDADE